jgi:hypothetical protein
MSEVQLSLTDSIGVAAVMRHHGRQSGRPRRRRRKRPLERQTAGARVRMGEVMHL